MGRKGKRQLETEFDSEKTSPPNKMAKAISASKADEILSKLNSIETRFADLEKEVAAISNFVKELDAVKKEVEILKESVLGFQRVEIESKKRSVLVKGLMFNTREKFESREETKKSLAELFDKLEMKPYLLDYQRLGGRKGEEDGSRVPVRIQFADVDQKLNLFSRLKIKGRELKEISVLTDYPSFQLQEFKKLNEAGYKIRSEKPGTRTRVVPRGNGLILQTRTLAADRWVMVTC